MSQHPEVIVLDDSSDESDSDSEEQLRVAVASSASSRTNGKAKKHTAAVMGDYVLSREERFLLGADDDDDESDSSGDDDEYDDHDDSFGDGASAFARKRRRASGSTETSKRRKTPTPSLPPSSRLANPKPPPPSRLTTARRLRSRDSESEEEEEDDNDQPFRHSTMVRKMKKARAMRSQLNGKPVPAKAPAARRPVNDDRDGRRARAKDMAETATKKTPTLTHSLKKPLAARKSAAPVNQKVVRPTAKRPREVDSDEYKDAESSQDEEEESEEDDEEESDGSEILRRRPTARINKAREETEVSEEDSASSGDSDEDLDSDDVSSRRAARNGGSGHTKPVAKQPAPKKKPPPKTSVPKPKPQSKTPPLAPTHRPSPSQAPPAAPRPRNNESSARPSRAVAALPENMSIEDMQAQERQLAYFKQQQKRKEQSSQQASSSAPRVRPPTNPGNARSGASTTNGARKPVTTQSVYRLPRQDSAASINSSAASSVASREPKPLARTTKAPAPFTPPALREPYSTTGTHTVVTTVSVALGAAMSFAAAEKVNHIPLPHNSWWRERLQFVRAPMNILPPQPHSCSWQAFSQVKERELCEFDESGTIAPLAELASPPKVSTNDLLTQSFESQEHINQKVRRVIDKSLPVLKQCHRRRVQDIISEMRKSLPWSRPHSRGGSSLRLGAEGCPGTEMTPIEHVQAKQILHASIPRTKTQQPNRLVGTIHYVLGFPRTRRTNLEADESLEDAVYELPHFPETIIEFGEHLAPMRRACAWISVKTNVHVDDDPILRYIPYLGDKERVNIDPRRYNATTLDKERSIVVELPDGDKQQNGRGVDAVKTQERLDTWRSDVASLVHATRSASDDEVMEYLLCMVIKQCGRSDKVIRALREVGGFAEPITDYDVIQKREVTARAIGKRLHDLRRCLDAENSSPSSILIREYVSQLVRTSNVQADDDSVDQKLRPPLASFSSNYLQHPEAKGVRSSKSMGHAMEWYRDLFCRRCYTYDCQQHGIQHPQPSRRTDPLNPVVKKSGVGLTRAKKARGNGADDVIEIASSSSSEDSEVDEENDDAQSTLSGSVDGEADAAEADSVDRRRSGRSGTRASSMASASLKVQEVMVEKERKKLQRKQAKQLQKLVRQVDDSEYLDDSYRKIVGPIMDTLISPAPTSLCGACCWKRSADASKDTTSAPELSEVAQLLLRKLLPLLGDNACIIARLLRDPTSRRAQDTTDSCAAIYWYMEEQRKKKTDDTNNPLASNDDHFQDKTGRRKQHNQYRSSAALHSGNRELIKRTRMNRAQQQTKEREHRYEPCNHSGACDAGNCDCLKRAHDCDKACSCSRECLNRHHGCKCGPGQCRKKGCLCYDARRECDPDYCFLCGAHEAAVMVFDATQQFMVARDVGICENVSLLRGVHKKIGVAFSATHGWGAYALEPIRKGEFVYEYRGALISDDEAERRGNIYDALNVSYLFDVNSDEVVDAMRKGNKIKFANHKTRELANLDTKILVVRGEHRIALFAKWDLHLGEELFFDYGYTNETAPEWSQLRTPHNARYTASEPEEEDDEDDDEELAEVLRLQS